MEKVLPVSTYIYMYLKRLVTDWLINEWDHFIILELSLIPQRKVVFNSFSITDFVDCEAIVKKLSGGVF